ncbi:Hypothetical predicted protein [Mytilus galloprovincialis]|uniref:B box-type domain-containing protein n=1 Tax=Mytilus galloprovincialis TaxID=29158 RepID=A0A8B6FPD5_MYTGA|nr:Hypothetical predicted protein [Mytilus galloprovincialis]
MESICNPCERRNIVSRLTHWCSDCEDGLCGKCLKDHNAMKLTQHHHVTELSEISSDTAKLLSIPQCDKHPDCREDFVCLDHDLVCCHACLKSDHKDCKHVSNVNVLSKGVSKSELFLSNKRTVQEVRETIKEIIKERQSVKEDVSKQQQRIKMEIANAKSKFMAHINNLENVLIHELSNIEKDNTILIEETITDVLKMEKEIEEDEKILHFIGNNGSESTLFLFLKKQRKKQEKTIELLEEIPPASKVMINFAEASHEIDAIKAIGFISVHYDIVNSGRSGIPSTSNEDRNIAAKTVSNQSEQTTPTGSIQKIESWKDTLQIQLDPKDFVDTNEKYAKLNLRKVWLAVQNDNYLLIAGHVAILEDQTEENESIEYMYKHNYRLVKYLYDVKGLTLSNGLNIYQYSIHNHTFNSIEMALRCIPKSTLAVLLYSRNFELVDTESMKRQWCLELDHEFQALATDEKFIYIVSGDMLYKYNRIGCLMKRINFIQCSWFSLSLNGKYACHNQNFRLLKADCSEIFSYHPAGLKAVTVDNTGNIYLATRDGIQLLNSLKMETEMVYRYDKKEAEGLAEIACNQVKQTLFLLGIQSTKQEEFGKTKCYAQMNSCSENSKAYYVCPVCNYRKDTVSNNRRCEGFRDFLLDFKKCVIKVLTK